MSSSEAGEENEKKRTCELSRKMDGGAPFFLFAKSLSFFPFTPHPPKIDVSSLLS